VRQARSGRRRARDQPDGQVVHQVAGDRHDGSGPKGRCRQRPFGRGLQPLAQRAEDSGLTQTLNQDEQAGNQRQYPP